MPQTVLNFLLFEREGGSCIFSPVVGQNLAARASLIFTLFHFIRPAVDAVMPPSQFIGLRDIFLPRTVQALFTAGLDNFL